jgi:hypothetical protein
MDERELAVYRKCTGRPDIPKKEFSEAWVIVGRRAGKTITASRIMLYEALRRDHMQYAVGGENPRGIIIATDRSQAGQALGYLRGTLEESEYLRPYLKESFKESLVLNNGTILDLQSCSYRNIRGRTCFCFIGEEAAFWHTEGERPAEAIIAAMRPSLATVPNAKMIIISSPYSRSGPLFTTWEKLWGKSDPNILVWRSETRQMNPLISADYIKDQLDQDLAAASSEWLAEWRDYRIGLLSHDVVKAACTLPGTLAPKKYVVYKAFTDASGGRSDDFALSIGHYSHSRSKYVIDLVKTWKPPFQPSEVIGEVSNICKKYNCRRITGDKYGAQFVVEQFKKFGIEYEACPINKSQIYLEAEGYFNQGLILLPKDKTLIGQLLDLERVTRPSGRDKVDHGLGAHDDAANAACGCLWSLQTLEQSAFSGCDLS